jgi:hypothetical protein
VSREAYISVVCKVHEHHSAWSVPAARGIQAHGGDGFDTATLNKIIVGSKFEDLVAVL